MWLSQLREPFCPAQVEQWKQGHPARSDHASSAFEIEPPNNTPSAGPTSAQTSAQSGLSTPVQSGLARPLDPRPERPNFRQGPLGCGAQGSARECHSSSAWAAESLIRPGSTGSSKTSGQSQGTATKDAERASIRAYARPQEADEGYL